MKRTILILTAAAACAVASAWYMQSSKLYIGGNLASSSVIQQGGDVFVPVKDVAQALHLTMRKTARGYELTDSGGADQIGGITGKVGDVLWNGFGRFQVVKAIRTKNYTNQFSGGSEQLKPNPKGYDLVVLVCHIKNGTKVTVVCSLPGGDDTALTDDSEHSYAPHTGLDIDCPSRGQTLLPGAAVDFALTFDVPPNTVLKDLVYQLDFSAVNGSDKKKFRVSL
jgi:hypothetical protein